MTDDERADLITDVADSVSRIVLDEYPRRYVGDGRCILTTRAGIEVLRYFRIEAKPVVVGVIAGNAAWCEWFSNGHEGEQPPESWSVGISQKGDGPRTPGVLGGHLVAVAALPGGNLLLDLDAGQSARPAKGIHVPDVVAAEWNGEQAVVELDEGGLLVWLRHERPPEFRSAGDWDRGRRIAGRIIRDVRARHPQPGVLS